MAFNFGSNVVEGDFKYAGQRKYNFTSRPTIEAKTIEEAALSKIRYSLNSLKNFNSPDVILNSKDINIIVKELLDGTFFLLTCDIFLLALTIVCMVGNGFGTSSFQQEDLNETFRSENVKRYIEHYLSVNTNKTQRIYKDKEDLASKNKRETLIRLRIHATMIRYGKTIYKYNKDFELGS
jgi:hypothetical protein